MTNISTGLFYVTIVTLVTLSGCSSISDQIADTYAPDSGTPVSSVPEGADVYVMGNKKGVTPMRIYQQDLYPASYNLNKEHLYGKVQLKKTGCTTYTRRLSRSEISGGLNVKLDCRNRKTTHPVPVMNEPSSVDPVKAPETASPAISYKPRTNSQDRQSTSPELSVHERKLQQLKSLQQLREEGMLSEEEERALRKKILKEY